MKTMLVLRIDTRHSNRATARCRSHLQGQNSANGFTLLEIMVALAIMAIVLVSVYRMHSQTLTMNTASRFYTLAPMLAQSKLAQIEASPTEIVGGDSGDFTDDFPGYNWSISTEEVSSEVLGESVKDLKRIEIIVSLNNTEYVYNVRTYRYIKE